MSVTIIFGGQYGDEGKGKVAHYFTVKESAKYCVRVGGPNSDHSVYNNNKKILFHTLPTGIIEKGTIAVLPAGSYIDLDILKHEIEVSGISKDRLLIDENAVIICNEYKVMAKESESFERIGSINSGTGIAVASRLARLSKKILAKHCAELKEYISDTKRVLRMACLKNEKIIIEGTQGYGLSVLHSKEYPYTTSRDTSASGFLSETGLSPFDVENIVMVIRAFPIRVSGNSGPLKNEISWDILKKELGCTESIEEYGACGKRLHRIARFDEDVVKRSIECNRPNIIVLNHLDLFPNYKTNLNSIINELEDKIGQKIDYYGDAPNKLLKT